MRAKIAVVEDNPDNRFLVQALLEETYDLLEYETGAEAVAGLVRDAPDLVLLDISLPEMDGTEVLRWIRTQESLQERTGGGSHRPRHGGGQGKVPGQGVQRLHHEAHRR